MPFISVPLDQVARASASASADDGSFFAAEQCAADAARDAADNRPLRPAMMDSFMSPLHAEARAGKCAEH
jgi:hypothetical protein